MPLGGYLLEVSIPLGFSPLSLRIHLASRGLGGVFKAGGRFGLAWLPLQSLAFVQILGGEKLLKFVEKCR